MKLRKIGSFLLALALIVGLLPGTIITAHAEETPAWTHMSPTEAELNMASYDAATDTIALKNEGGFAARMQYMGLADAAGKDWTIEFDMSTDGGAIGVYQYDASGAMYGAYLDTNGARLDSVHYADWATPVDGFFFYGDTNPSFPTANWDPATDKPASHIRVDFIRGEGGTMAGGTVTYYKRLNDTEYAKIGTLNVSETLADHPELPNIFGIHMVLGTATVSNVTVTEYAGDPTYSAWNYMSKFDQTHALATYDKATDTMTLAADGGWCSRMQNLEFRGKAGKDYAIEFTLNVNGGAFGVYTYDTNANDMYGVYIDAGAGGMDALHMVGGVAVDDFNFRESVEGKTMHGQTPMSGWDPALISGGRIRVEFRSLGNSLAGGQVCYYKQDATTGEFLKLGTVNTPATFSDNPNVDNIFGIHLWLGAGTISDIDITEFDAPDWVHMSDAEENTKLAVYDQENDTITFVNDGGWANRMQYMGIADAAGKDWTVEFDASLAGGALGIYQYEASGAMYGAYFDVAGSALDSVSFSDWGTQTNGFYFYEQTTPESYVANWAPATDLAAFHIRADFVRGEGGTMAGGTVTYYKKDLTTGQYKKLGVMNVPETIVDDPNLANRFGMHLVLGSGTVSNITVTEYEPINWVHLSDAEMNLGNAAYSPAEDKITFKNAADWSPRMQNIAVKAENGKDYVIEFTMNITGGAIGAFNFEGGDLYGVYIDTGAGALDPVHIAGGVTHDSFWFHEATTEGMTVHPQTPIEGWDAALVNGGRIRVHFKCGESGTLAGGTVTYYKLDTATGNYVKLGSVATPETLTNNPDLDNYFGLMLWLGEGSVSDLKVEACVAGEPVKENVISGSCTETGSYESVVYCANCGIEMSRETVITEKLDHIEDVAVEENRVEATCSAEGSYELVINCAACGEEMSRETVTIEKLAHTEGYTNITEDTHDVACSVCGESIATGVAHEYVDGKCACDAEEPVSGPVDTPALKFVGNYLSFQEYIGMQTMLQTKLVKDYTKVYVEAIQTPVGGVASEPVILEPIDLNSSYKVFDMKVMAWDMTDTITMTLYAEDANGVVYKGATVTATVESLALEKLASLDGTNAAGCRVLVDMLNYGAAVQTAYDHNADSLPNTQIGDYAKYATAETPTIGGEVTSSGAANGISDYGVYVSMQAQVELTMMIKPKTGTSIEDLEMHVTPEGGDTRTFDHTTFKLNSSYYVPTVALKAADFRTPQTMEIYNKTTGQVVSKVYVATVEAKAAAYLGTDYETVVVNMMKYGDAVAAMVAGQ